MIIKAGVGDAVGEVFDDDNVQSTLPLNSRGGVKGDTTAKTLVNAMCCNLTPGKYIPRVRTVCFIPFEARNVANVNEYVAIEMDPLMVTKVCVTEVGDSVGWRDG